MHPFGMRLKCTLKTRLTYERVNNLILEKRLNISSSKMSNYRRKSMIYRTFKTISLRWNELVDRVSKLNAH